MEMACEAAGVRHRGLHALRHSFASNLCARGAEVKIISKLFGHASVEITYNRYIHFFEVEIDDTPAGAWGVAKRWTAVRSSCVLKMSLESLINQRFRRCLTSGFIGAVS